MEARQQAALGHNFSTYPLADSKSHYSKTWDYMASLKPDGVFLLGDNVYNDGIQNWGIDGYGAPFGNNLAAILADADTTFMKVHGFLTPEGEPGVMFRSFLDILTDKVMDAFVDNAAFAHLRDVTNNGVHFTWDDHDYLTNDPSNPHFMRPEFRQVEIDALTGFDKEHMRFPPGEQGIERSWTKTFDNHGEPFVVRFIILDEETTHVGTLGMDYVVDSSSETGFKPVRKASGVSGSGTENADPSFVEDFDELKRDFFGADQLAWFVSELDKPADLRLVFNGGPNFEIDYSYNALTDYPGAKRQFVEALRASGAEKVVFFGGDSHATYVTKVPDLVGYPLYTVIGSGMTQGLSYDRYVGFWGDISHRHMVAAGSSAKYDSTASFAEVELLFDPVPLLRFTPHLADDARGGDVDGADAMGRWGPWRAQREANEGEMWAAQYDIKLSELVNAPNAAVDNNRFVPENIYVKYKPPVPADHVAVSLTITNAQGEGKTFQLQQGASWHLCGAGYFGLCKDQYGAFAYQVPREGDYVPSHENSRWCEHAGLVGDTITWSISAAWKGNSSQLETLSGEHKLLIRNNALYSPAEDSPYCSALGSSKGGVGCVNFTNVAVSYSNVAGPTVGVAVTDIINEPTLYGGHTVPVAGFLGGHFDATAVDALYQAYLADPSATNKAAVSAAYLCTYFDECA